MNSKDEHIELSNYTTIREPILDAKKFNRVLFTDDANKLLELWDIPLVKDIIFTSNRGLFKSMDSFSSLTKKKKRGATHSFINYLLRSGSKATPYGLTASFSMNTKKENLQHENFSLKVKVDPSVELLENIIQLIENNDHYIKKARVKIHPIVINRDKKLIFLFRKGFSTTKVAELEKNNFINNLYDICNEEFVDVEALFNMLKSMYPQLEINGFIQYIKTLLKNDFLISNYRVSPTTHNPLTQILSLLAESKENGSNFFTEIETINSFMREFNLDDLTKVLSRFETIINNNELKLTVKPSDSYNLLLLNKNRSVVNQSFHEEKLLRASKVIPYFINRNSINIISKKAVNYFLNTYGNQLVPLKEVVYESDLLSYLDDANQYSKENKKENFKILDELLFDTIQKGNRSLEITDDILESLKESDQPIKNKKIEGFELIYYMADEKLIIEKGFGSNIIGRLNGRFLGALDEEVKEEYLNKTKETIEDRDRNSIFAEVTCKPISNNIANISRAPTPHNYEIALNTDSDSSKTAIPITDLYIGCNGEELYLWSETLQRQVIPRQSHAAALNSNFPKIYIFLVQLGLSKQTLINDFCSFELNKYIFLPEIKYKDIILRRAEWNLDSNILKNLYDDKDIILSLKKWKQKYQVPDLVGLSSGETPTVFNLNNEFHLEMIQKILKKNLGKIDIYSFIDISYQSKDLNFKQYITQISSENDEVNSSRKDISKQRYSPSKKLNLLDDWIYLKIYVNKYHDKDAINIIKNLITFRTFDNWHFVNYRDVKDHIRLRIKSNNKEETIEILSQIFEKLNKLMSEKIIDDYSINNYEPEYNRYGGKEIYPLILDWFKIDSVSVLSLLNKQKVSIVTAVINIHFILSNLGFSDAEINKMYERHRNNSKKEYRDYQKDFFDNYNHQLNNQIYNVQRNILKVINKKIESLSYEYKTEIALSIVHMHLNRYIGIDLEVEKLIYGLLEKFTKSRLYLNKQHKNLTKV